MPSARPESAEQVARRALELIEERLPQAWTVRDVRASASGPADARLDYVATLVAADDTPVNLVIEAKQSVERRDVARLEQALARAGAETGALPVLVARYLSPPVREELALRRIPFVDATGNMRIALDAPALFLADRGADRDPWRTAGRPRGTLKGEPAARVVRALIDFGGDWKVTELVERAGSSVGATYRVVEYLESESLITPRNTDGRFEVPSWSRLLRAWSTDYNTFAQNRVSTWFDPRGVDAALTRVAQQVSSATERGATRLALTGSAAAAQWAPYAPVKTGILYVSSTSRAESDWGLRPVDSSPNILLIEPKSSTDVAFDRATLRADGLPVAAVAQVAVDLLNGPGRSANEAEELITWMEANESKWRR